MSVTRRLLQLGATGLAFLLLCGGQALAADDAEMVRLVDVSRDEVDGSSTWRYEIIAPTETVLSWTLEVAQAVMDSVVWSSVDFQRIQAEGLRFVIDEAGGQVEFRLAGGADVLVGEVGVSFMSAGGAIRTVASGPILAESGDADDEDEEQTIEVSFSRPGSEPVQPVTDAEASVPLPRTGGPPWPWLGTVCILAAGGVWWSVRARCRR